MIPAVSLAKLCRDIYAGCHISFDRVVETENVCLGIATVNGQKVLAFRGSLTLLDWIHDFQAIPVAVPLIGTVHEGFWKGIEEVWDLVGLQAGEEVIITGHSLGCAHAALFARLCLLRGIRVMELYLFAPPRIGYQDFYDGLRNVADIRAWCNGIDPVPQVPIVLQDEPWCQFPLNGIAIPPGGIDDFDPAKWHNISLYIQGVTND